METSRPTPPANSHGLSSAAQVAELADALSACADDLHERILRELHACDGRSLPSGVQDAMRALFDDEVLLRQRANGLYADAAAHIVAALGTSQSQLMALTADAAEKIRRIGLVGEVTGLVAGLLALAGAASSGQAGPVLLALEKIRQQVKAIEAYAPPAAPPPAAG